MQQTLELIGYPTHRAVGRDILSHVIVMSKKSRLIS